MDPNWIFTNPKLILTSAHSQTIFIVTRNGENWNHESSSEAHTDDYDGDNDDDDEDGDDDDDDDG